MMWNREGSIFHQIPQEALYEILQCVEWDWFEEDHSAIMNSEESDTNVLPEYYDWGW